MGSLRIETGPYQPEDDWTGYFVRGDMALGEADLMLTVARMLERMKDADENVLNRSTLALAVQLLRHWGGEFKKVYEGD